MYIIILMEGITLVKIRWTRLGKHKNPFYRIVATDARNKGDGGYLALLGTYEPFSGKVNFKSEEAVSFLLKGAQPSETVLNLLKAKGVWNTFLAAKGEKVVSKETKTADKKKKRVTSNKKAASAKRQTRKANLAKHVKPTKKADEQTAAEATTENK